MKGNMKGNFYNKKKVKYLNMINSGKAKKNSSGEIIKDAVFQSTKSKDSRIEPLRSWFADTKVVSQNELEKYRNCVQTKSPYEVLLSTGNVPYSLINNEVKLKRKHDFSNSFGKKTNSKKPKLQISTVEELKEKSEKMLEEHQKIAEKNLTFVKDNLTTKKVKGQSHRIWNELYKVLDSSDVVVHVLDARDPLGTMCNQIEEYINKKAKHKHLMYVLNKVDLVSTSVTAAWLKFLSKNHPVVAFHSNSLENNYGKTNLINIFRQLKTLYKKSSMSIGFVGYPNSGKSSIINILRDKEVCSVAPVAGQTRVWQYITLMKDLYLIDCPGVVPITDLKEAILHGAIRVESIEDPDIYVNDIIKKVGKEAIEATYKIKFSNFDDLFVKMAKRFGKIVKQGEPNIDLIAKMILHDFLRGKIPYSTMPPVE